MEPLPQKKPPADIDNDIGDSHDLDGGEITQNAQDDDETSL